MGKKLVMPFHMILKFHFLTKRHGGRNKGEFGIISKRNRKDLNKEGKIVIWYPSEVETIERFIIRERKVI